MENLNRKYFNQRSLDGTGRKYCPTCKEIKEQYDFGKDRSNPTGFRGQCKECSKEAKKRLHPSTAVFLSKPERKRRKRASEIVNNSQGKIKKGPCSICGTNELVEGHHEDYSKPLDVIWLCQKHHKELHVRKRIKERK